MKADIFIHYSNRVKMRSRSILKTTAELNKTAKSEIVNYLNVVSFYYKEITISLKVFRYNLKDINRF